MVAGITPVSAGGDSIGGSVTIQSKPPVFATADEGVHTGGSVSTFYRSNNRAIGGSVSGDVATENYSLNYSGSAVRARDYHDGDGNRIATSQYAAETMPSPSLCAMEENLVTLQAGQQFIPYEGFPNQRMDMLWNRGRFLNASYKGEFDWGDDRGPRLLARGRAFHGFSAGEIRRHAYADVHQRKGRRLFPEGGNSTESARQAAPGQRTSRLHPA